MAIGDGFVKVKDNKVLVLVSFALRPEEIDRGENEAIIKEEELNLHNAKDLPDESDPRRIRLASAKACLDMARSRLE